MRRVFISAGEVSGDIVAAKLIEALREADASTIVDGIGGPRMARAGATLVASADHIGAVGLSEGLAMAPAAVRVFLKATRHCRAQRPDVAVLIANDVFNIVLGRRLRAKGIPTIALFPPQSWIWQSFARAIAPSLDLVLASFPDEARCYRQAGVATEFVGHYLADVLPPATPDDRAAARRSLGLPPSAPVVALLPGSRQREIDNLLPVLMDAADIICHGHPDVQLVAALATEPAGNGALRTRAGHRVRVSGDSHLIMRSADVVASCSGTATLEAALLGVPMVVVYKTSWLTCRMVRAWIRAGLIREETIALPNLLLGRHVVPELTQQRAAPPTVADAVLSLIADDAPRRAMQAALREVRAHVAQPGTLAEAARMVLARADG